MIKGLWNYAIKAKDIEKTTDFYIKCLDGELLKSGEVLGSIYRLIRIGHTRLIIFDKAPYESQLGLNLPPGFLHDVYEVDDHESHVARLREYGIKFIVEPTVIETDWDVRKIAFYENPEGVRTEILEILEEKDPV